LFEIRSELDSEATANVIRVTGGNVRPFERLLIQIQPVIETNKMGLVSEPMEAARENLIVGRTQ
jgi:hypothetical protein